MQCLRRSPKRWEQMERRIETKEKINRLNLENLEFRGMAGRWKTERKNLILGVIIFVFCVWS